MCLAERIDAETEKYEQPGKQTHLEARAGKNPMEGRNRTPNRKDFGMRPVAEGRNRGAFVVYV